MADLLADWNGPLALSEVEVKPKYFLNVGYEGISVGKLGQVLTPTKVEKCPTIEWEGMDPDKLYVVVLTDPDVPCRSDPHLGQWQHYMVVNMKGNNLSSGSTLTEYIGSAPGEKTGLHRYIWLVYGQPGPLKYDECILGATSAEHRANFKISDFRKKYKLGPPVAGTCYQAEWDDMVPKIYKQLGL